MAQLTQSPFEILLRRHHELDFEIRTDHGKRFVSDWNCTHPFTHKFIGSMEAGTNRQDKAMEYKFHEDDKNVATSISLFHEKNENFTVSNKTMIAGDGSTPIIAAFCCWLIEKNIRAVHYIPPLYYNFYYFLSLFGIKLRPVASRHPFENNFTLNLPRNESVLILCDPVWYAGASVDGDTIDEIIRWQKKTSSMVFVDGSFQYMKWRGGRREHTSRLDHSMTLRLICPTKQVAIHGYRFSYILVPEQFRDRIRYIYANMHGATSADNLVFASHIMKVLSEPPGNSFLTEYISRTFDEIKRSGAISSFVMPDCGYFIFAKPSDGTSLLSMDGDFFQQPRLKEYIRINLLAPSTQAAYSPS